MSGSRVKSKVKEKASNPIHRTDPTVVLLKLAFSKKYNSGSVWNIARDHGRQAFFGFLSDEVSKMTDFHRAMCRATVSLRPPVLSLNAWKLVLKEVQPSDSDAMFQLFKLVSDCALLRPLAGLTSLDADAPLSDDVLSAVKTFDAILSLMSDKLKRLAVHDDFAIDIHKKAYIKDFAKKLIILLCSHNDRLRFAASNAKFIDMPQCTLGAKAESYIERCRTLFKSYPQEVAQGFIHIVDLFLANETPQRRPHLAQSVILTTQALAETCGSRDAGILRTTPLHPGCILPYNLILELTRKLVECAEVMSLEIDQWNGSLVPKATAHQAMKNLNNRWSVFRPSTAIGPGRKADSEDGLSESLRKDLKRALGRLEKK